MDERDEGRPVADESERIGIRRRLVESVRRDDVGGLSAEIAYRFLFAVFPFGLFVAALAAFVAAALAIDNPAEQVLAGLGDNLPPTLAGTLRPELERLMSSPRADLVSIGALGALWTATGGTNALVKGIHRAYDIPESRPFILRYAIAVTLTLVEALVVIASFVTIVGGALITDQLAQRFGIGGQAFQVLQLARWPVVFLVLTAGVAILYRYAPNIVVPWRWILLGSAVFTFGWLVATTAIAFYAERVANFGATYGSLGGVIVMMLWFYVTSAVLILGAEVTAAIARERSPAELRTRPEEERAASAVQGAMDDARRGVEGAAATARGDNANAARPSR